MDVTSSQSDTTGNSRRRRRDTGQEAANDTAAFTPTASNFSMAITTTGCRSYDKATDTWTSDNCEVPNILRYPMNNNYYIIVLSVIL